jgi:hypothetical protein
VFNDMIVENKIRYLRLASKTWMAKIFFIMLFSFSFHLDRIIAQELPPKPMQIYAVPGQGLLFGAFVHGTTGGTVIMNANGIRSSTGDIILLGLGANFSPAVYEVEANSGTVVNIMNGPDVSLSGSNGGTIMLHINNADVGSPFIVTTQSPVRMQVRVGGTLTIGNSLINPPGAYSGSYQIIFIQE